MKTETKISVIAYDVELIDLRTGEHLKDRVVLDRSWLDVLHKMSISDRDYLMQNYSHKGYLMLKMSTQKKVSLTVDLEELYTKQIQMERMEQLLAFGKAHSDAQPNNQEADACD